MRTAMVSAHSVRNGVKEARRQLGLLTRQERIKDEGVVVSESGDGGLWRITFANGDVAEISISHRGATQFHGVI